MRHRVSALLCAAAMTLCAAISVVAQPVGAATDDRSFSFSSDRTIVVFSEGREKTTLIGNATVVSNSTNLYANYIEVYGEDFRFVECTGSVEVFDDQEGYRLKTDNLFFDRELEIIRGRGANVMEDFSNEIVIKGEFLEHRNAENRSEVQVGVRILSADIAATAEFVRYQRDSELLEFSGLPLVRWKGDQYQAARIIVDMKRDTVYLQGEVYGEIRVESNNESAAPTPGEAPAPPAAAETSGYAFPPPEPLPAVDDEPAAATPTPSEAPAPPAAADQQRLEQPRP